MDQAKNYHMSVRNSDDDFESFRNSYNNDDITWYYK